MGSLRKSQLLERNSYERNFPHLLLFLPLQLSFSFSVCLLLRSHSRMAGALGVTKKNQLPWREELKHHHKNGQGTLIPGLFLQILHSSVPMSHSLVDFPQQQNMICSSKPPSASSGVRNCIAGCRDNRTINYNTSAQTKDHSVLFTHSETFREYSSISPEDIQLHCINNILTYLSLASDNITACLMI